jgi:hypothetical protein
MVYNPLFLITLIILIIVKVIITFGFKRKPPTL